MRHNLGQSIIIPQPPEKHKLEAPTGTSALFGGGIHTCVKPISDSRTISASRCFHQLKSSWRASHVKNCNFRKSVSQVMSCLYIFRQLTMSGLLGLSSGPSRMWFSAAGDAQSIYRICSIHANMIGFLLELLVATRWYLGNQAGSGGGQAGLSLSLSTEVRPHIS